MPDEQGNVQSAAGAGKKMWYVIGGIVVIIILGWIVTKGLGGVAMPGSGIGVDRNADGSATYSNSEGSVTVGGASMPETWPSDAPGNYANASIQYSGSSNPQTGKPGAAVVYTVNASTQAVADYYKTELTRAGWTIEATANTGAATVLSAKKDNRTFGVYIASAGDAGVSVTAGIEM
ncbi:MAG: hypothetical protein RLZZ416_700 [Candidatus Parcubacteria bacterium]|jgi:hypothetical protein